MQEKGNTLKINQNSTNQKRNLHNKLHLPMNFFFNSFVSLIRQPYHCINHCSYASFSSLSKTPLTSNRRERERESERGRRRKGKEKKKRGREDEEALLLMILIRSPNSD